MYVVTKTFEFAAAHHNPMDDGPCRRNHGHAWAVRVEYAGDRLDERGWLIGFDDIRGAVGGLVDYLDHQDLNAILDINPSTENLARWFYDRLVSVSLPVGVRLVAVDVTERAGDWRTYARYQP